MVSTFHGLELGRRGLTAGQASIATTGHNIANANTKGYSRQQVNNVTAQPLDTWTTGNVNPGQLGSGVSVESITRVRDHFLDRQYRDQSGTLGQWQAKQATFDQLETVINEPSDTGLNAAMDRLQGAWQDLANDPASPSAQAVVKERGQAFLEVAESMDVSMGAVLSDIERQTNAAVSDATEYLKQIDALNQSIKRTGTQANDLLDQRDAAVEQLSKLATISVIEDKGMYTISLNGTAVVKGTAGEETATTAEPDVAALLRSSTGGKLKGLADSKILAENQRTAVANIVSDFASANGIKEEDGSKGNLFIQNEDGSLEVNRSGDRLTVPENLETDLEPIKKSYQALVSELGAKSQSATSSIANYEATLQATDNRRQSVTGVSLDEEMANLIKFQHAYSAAARLVSTTDQMLDTIINRMAAR
ncbi:flagellar hook-associated protein FlgK [Planococcus salinus]|uniref:Flagellar hook-associated protein 1 n=1 Tax=Planococcus salinus TaxID=1848460 RepID=A0A3M8P6D0_9BACL|nr:flagellar hook-associated protein FlgK [Planococcus salinus]RNF38764.1 flagellar hook-associated protein FlgK [Planococcus salinus]